MRQYVCPCLTHRHVAEECNYSNFAFMHSNLTFLRFDAMVPTRYHLASPGAGVYAVMSHERGDMDKAHSTAESRSSLNSLLQHHERDWVPHPTLSSAGVEYPVELLEGQWPYFVWFPQQYSVHYSTNYNNMGRDTGQRYVSIIYAVC